MKQRYGYVYSLRDPNTGESHYIGTTKDAPMKCLGKHIDAMFKEGPFSSKKLNKWLYNLYCHGQFAVPKMHILEEVPLSGVRSTDQIELCKAKQKHLQNIKKTAFSLLT